MCSITGQFYLLTTAERGEFICLAETGVVSSLLFIAAVCGPLQLYRALQEMVRKDEHRPHSIPGPPSTEQTVLSSLDFNHWIPGLNLLDS